MAPFSLLFVLFLYSPLSLPLSLSLCRAPFTQLPFHFLHFLPFFEQLIQLMLYYIPNYSAVLAGFTFFSLLLLFFTPLLQCSKRESERERERKRVVSVGMDACFSSCMCAFFSVFCVCSSLRGKCEQRGERRR